MMNSMADEKLTRIGVFYDGGFFSAVSDYYRYYHSREARLSIEGLHRFVIREVAAAENVDERYCQVVDAHYFRGRFSASAAEQRGKLLVERQFDDVLMRAGIVTHYLPQAIGQQEKGIDVWLALEAFELAVYKRFNLLVLIAGDGDYLALIRKLNTLGTRVMLLAWDFHYTDEGGRERNTRTAQSLLDEVTYPVMMHTLIDDRSRKSDPIVSNLFMAAHHQSEPLSSRKPAVAAPPARPPGNAVVEKLGQVMELRPEGYGFIADGEQDRRWFFHASALVGTQFEALNVGDPVSFRLEQGDRGLKAVDVSVPSSPDHVIRDQDTGHSSFDSREPESFARPLPSGEEEEGDTSTLEED